MSEEIAYMERIERYLQGLMNAREKMDFEAEMQKNAALREDVEVMRIANEMIEDQELVSIRSKIQSDLKGGSLNTIWILSSILVIGILITYFLLPGPAANTHNQVQASYTFNDSSGHSNSSAVIKSTEKGSDPKINSLGQAKKELPVIESNEQIVSPINRLHNYSDSTKQEVSEKENFNKSDPPIVKNSCDGVRISSDITTSKSCANKNSGAVLIANIQGGATPYECRLKGKSPFRSVQKYDYLTAGEYQVQIRDKNGCLYTSPVVMVESKECEEPFSSTYTPAEESNWLIPVKSSESGVLKIQNQAGVVVHTASIEKGQPSEWDGISNKGNAVPQGYYMVILELEDGTIRNGFLTINR